MPHIHVEYSANLEEAVDVAAFCELLRATAAGIEAFPMPGIRVRAMKADHVALADGRPDHGFVDVCVRLRGGRPHAVKVAAVETLFTAARDFLAPVMAARPLAVSFEMRDIDPALSPKAGSIRDFMVESDAEL